jgi:copper ion binding protein
MAQQVIKVTGMSCNHCKAAVEKAVGAVGGVDKVDADVKANRVTVSYREEPGALDRVKAAITEAGYTVAS